MTNTPVSFISGLKSHDQFFTRIINMIPAELYRHSLSEDGDGAINTKYYKHRKLPLTPDEKKLLSKQKIAEKYAPKQPKESDDENDDKSEGESEDEVTEEDGTQQERYPTYSSESCNDISILRQRLQERISGLKVDRTSTKEHKIKANADSAAKKALAAKQPENKKNNSQKKRKHSVSTAEGNEIVTKIQKVAAAAIEPANAIEVATGNGLEFNKMMMINEDKLPAGVDKNKGKPGSKVQRLKRLLDEAHQKREKITSLSNSTDPEEQQALRNVKWSDAIKSASGDKSVLLANSSGGLTAEAKLKKAIKRKEKSKQKSAAEWKARLDAVEEAKAARITKREENITERKNTKHGILSDADKEKLAKSVKNNNSNKVNDKGDAGKDGTRVGFEGKKTTGEFLNKKNSK